jgi:quinoprotein glucose dehydrogenase
MKRIGIAIFAAFLGIVGLTLAVGGAMLAAEGGSVYYVLTGAAVLVSAFGLMRGARYAAWAYGAMLACTLIWSLWEAGLDPWALVPRLAGPALIGLLFLLPAIAWRSGASRWWAGAPSAAALGLLALAFILHQTAESGLPGARAVAAANGAQTWQHWGNDVGGQKYVRSAQIDTSNVGELELAWRYDSDIAPGSLVSLEAAPIAMDGRLYMCLESGTMVALDQDTGREIWRYRGLPKDSPLLGWKCRGAAYHAAATLGPNDECARRLFITTAIGQLTALDAATGRPCSGFARGGSADLRQGMGRIKPDEALPTSPPTVVSGVVVVGQSISDFESIDAASGVIRGYDALTGELRWAWDAGRPGQTKLQPGETYTRDTPNAWSVFSGDESLGLVFVGTGNSPPDYFSGFRSKIADDFTDNVVVDVATGAVKWRFKTVNHDLWDYDLASQPVTVDLPDGRPALIVPTKRGQIFVLDRRTGQPIDPVVQRPVPQGGVEGEWTAPTQPYTTGFPSVAGPRLRERDMWGITPLDQMACRLQFRRANYEGDFTPITTRPTITYPAVGGGINWGSVSVDPQRGLMVVNALRFANLNRLEKREPGEVAKGGFEGGVITFPQAGTPYAFKSFPFLSPIFIPCQEPPFGTISVFDIATRKLVWEKPLGTAAGSGPLGMASHVPLQMGAPNFGGSLSTAGGLTFIAAAQDRKLRAYDIANGKELWSAELPAIGAANPVSYVSPKTGRQYVVIAAGGHFSMPGPHAAAIMAYALPQH